jgi:GDP-4-dehydro-6-deoxy-D-mannose reductase
LVTGAQGFIGRYLVSHWLSRESDVAILGVGRSPDSGEAFTHSLGEGARARAPLPRPLRRDLDDRRYGYESIDLRSSTRVAHLVQNFRPDIVVHLAGSLRDDPLNRLIGSNVQATAGLIDGIGLSGTRPHRVVIASTGGVYGPFNPAALPLHETSPCEADELYAATKRASEHIARALARRHRLPLITGRIFNVVGPGQDERHFCGSLCGQLARTPAGQEASLKVGSLEATRDFVDVRDVARALTIITLAGAVDTTYNIASGVETPMHEVLRMVVNMYGGGRSVRLERQPWRQPGVARHYADIGRLRGLGYEPSLSLAQSLVDTLGYYEAVGLAPSGLVAKVGDNAAWQAVRGDADVRAGRSDKKPH